MLKVYLCKSNKDIIIKTQTKIQTLAEKKFRLDKTYMRIQLKIKSIDEKSLKIYLTKIEKVLKTIKIDYKLFNLPKKRRRITLLKSPHVNKTAREQFEIIHYTSVIQLFSANKFNALKILTLNKPKTVKVSIKNL